MSNINWGDFPNFSKEEFDCQETGENEMRRDFLYKLQQLRNEYGKAMVISSGYRSPRHSIEARKPSPGTHAQGIAADILCHGQDAHELLRLAMKHNFTGIGVSQKGRKDKRFIHLDIREYPMIWSY